MDCFLYVLCPVLAFVPDNVLDNAPLNERYIVGVYKLDRLDF